jgi:hypothetical protein
MEPLEFRYLISKKGREKSDILLENYTQEQLCGKIVTWNGKTFKYMVFDTPHHLYTYIMQDEKNRFLHEVIFGDRKQRIYFDIDKAPIEAFNRIRADIRHVWQTSKILPDYEQRKNIKVISLNSGGASTKGDIPAPNIISRHIIINYYIPNYETNKLFAQEVINALKNKDDAQYIDMIYTTITNVRILYCRKYKNGWLGPPKLPITTGFAFKDSLIQA